MIALCQPNVFGRLGANKVLNVGLQISRHCLTARIMEKTKISEHLILSQQISEAEMKNGAKTRPLVLLFPWINAKPAAVQKYCELYYERDMDVLTISCTPKHFLWPASAEPLAEEVLNYLKKHQIQRPLFIHALSIGAYFFTVCVMHMRMNPGKFKPLEHQICGQVFDSIVIGSLQRMSLGVSNSMTSSHIMNSAIRGSIMAYFAITHNHTVAFYDKAIPVFKDQPCRVPSLIFYSVDDPMSDPDAVGEVIDKWNKLGIPVTPKCWDRSKHAGHLKEHKEEYVNTLDKFLGKLTFGTNVMSQL